MKASEILNRYTYWSDEGPAGLYYIWLYRNAVYINYVVFIYNKFTGAWSRSVDHALEKPRYIRSLKKYGVYYDL